MSKTNQSSAQGAATAPTTYEAKAYAAPSATRGLATATIRGAASRHGMASVKRGAR